MPGWVDTEEEEAAWGKAIAIVEKQRNKDKADFVNKDYGLVTHIAKNILSSSENLQKSLSRVQQILSARKSKQEADESLPDDASAVLCALKKVMSFGGQSIAAIRKAEEVGLEELTAKKLAKDLEDIATRLEELLQETK